MRRGPAMIVDTARPRHPSAMVMAGCDALRLHRMALRDRAKPGFTEQERAAIDEAIQAGRITRIAAGTT